MLLKYYINVNDYLKLVALRLFNEGEIMWMNLIDAFRCVEYLKCKKKVPTTIRIVLKNLKPLYLNNLSN